MNDGPADLAGRVEVALAEFLDGQSTPPGAEELSSVLGCLREYVLRDGKRVRPVFCYWGWRGAGGEDCPQIVSAAASLELFHAFALIHDDIMDDADTRRGGPAMHRLLAEEHVRNGWRGPPGAFGTATGILLGDLCLMWADELLHHSGLDARRLARGRWAYDLMRTEIVAGQYLDVLETARRDGDVRRSLTIARLKTAAYTVQRPLHLGAALAGAGREVLGAYSRFAIPLGEAFQMRDDVLGVYGDPAVTGKSAMDDMHEGKPTVLIGQAVRHATAEQRARIRALYGDPELGHGGAAELREIIAATGALEHTENMIGRRTERAFAALHGAPIRQEARQALLGLAERAVERTR
ncbi:polyprenyl synthetase family protein [Nonomuraea sp. NPDC050404]|uniref:polyprenyl synthetase family protein n=1 Tax=Nonomuraea sp. NPDC050404 TaxID=3155783 RepID=UPI0033EA5AF8